MLNRRIPAILFLGVIFIPAIISLYLYASQLIIQYKMREEMEHASLVTVIMPASQLCWIRPGKEASINGNLFDVENYELKGDSIVLTGLFDKDEDLLMKHISYMHQNYNKSNITGGGGAVFKWLSCFPLYLEANDLKTLLMAIRQQYSLPGAIKFHSVKILIDSPPPKPDILFDV